MDINNKALGSYVLVLAVFSFLMSLILMLLLNFAYDPDHPACSQIDFNAKSLCETNGGYKVLVSNLGNKSLSYKINNEISSTKNLNPEENKEIILTNGDIFNLVPSTVDDEGNRFTCKSQGVKLNMEVIGKC